MDEAVDRSGPEFVAVERRDRERGNIRVNLGTRCVVVYRTAARRFALRIVARKVGADLFHA